MGCEPAAAKAAAEHTNSTRSFCADILNSFVRTQNAAAVKRSDVEGKLPAFRAVSNRKYDHLVGSVVELFKLQKQRTFCIPIRTVRQAGTTASACRGEQQGEAVAGLLLSAQVAEHVNSASIWYVPVRSRQYVHDKKGKPPFVTASSSSLRPQLACPSWPYPHNRNTGT